MDAEWEEMPCFSYCFSSNDIQHTPESFPDLFLPVFAGIVHRQKRIRQKERNRQKKIPQALGSTIVVCVQFILGSINIAVICVDHWKG